MFTKEELLQKGLSEEDADKIITAFESNEDPENSIQLLEKALNEGDNSTPGDSPDVDPLLKAKKGKEDDDDSGDDDDYNPEFMKKHMKRYMKENKKSCGKMAKEVGIYGEEMKKAIDEMDTNLDGAVVEMADLKPILEQQVAFNESLSKAVEELSGRVLSISTLGEKQFDVMQKAAQLQVDQAKSMETFLSQPAGKKGKTAISTEDMKKAKETLISPESTQYIYDVLMKATKDGDRNAGMIISAFESSGKNVNMLNPGQKKYINELITKEVH
jgi:hypothetical protein